MLQKLYIIGFIISIVFCEDTYNNTKGFKCKSTGMPCRTNSDAIITSLPGSNQGEPIAGILNLQNTNEICTCSDEIIATCKTNQNCNQCVPLQGNCDGATNQCCPITDGRVFCNAESGRCEATRFCGEEGTKCAFDDISADEIRITIRVIKDSNVLSQLILFPIVRIQEPKKYDWNKGIDLGRIAYAAVFDFTTKSLYKVLVDLQAEKIIKVAKLQDKLARILIYEVLEAIEIVRRDGRWLASVLKRNLNPNYAELSTEPVGSSGPLLRGGGVRVLRIGIFYGSNRTKYADWSPIEGIQITVDLNRQLVTEYLDVEVTNQSSVYQILPTISPKIQSLKPLVITQSEGNSIKVSGQGIQWYKWNFRYSVDPIHGLQLYHVRYHADCEDRLVLYKLSLSEMFVPYGAEGRTWRNIAPFDVGEIGIGLYANSLNIGLDVPENAIFMNCVLANETGAEPIFIPRCVGAYEQDVGVLYKHVDVQSDVRRGRQLVVTLTSTVGNYEYAYYYIFHMDGVLEIRVRLTGIIFARGERYKFNDPTCLQNCKTFISDFLSGPPHQHFFNYRIDFDVDGPNNYVLEVDVTNDPIGPENPDGGAFSPKKTIIATEGSRDHNFKTSRTWHVVNANSRNRFGSPRGYAIKTRDVAYTYFKPGNPHLPQAEFVTAPFWVTAYNDREQGAAGEFSRSGVPGQGLPEYVRDTEPIKNKDSVVWYTFGVTHCTRPEEWPIMNVHETGFSLVPFNFLSQNSEVPLKGVCSS